MSNISLKVTEATHTPEFGITIHGRSTLSDEYAQSFNRLEDIPEMDADQKITAQIDGKEVAETMINSAEDVFTLQIEPQHVGDRNLELQLFVDGDLALTGSVIKSDFKWKLPA